MILAKKRVLPESGFRIPYLFLTGSLALFFVYACSSDIHDSKDLTSEMFLYTNIDVDTNLSIKNHLLLVIKYSCKANDSLTLQMKKYVDQRFDGNRVYYGYELIKGRNAYKVRFEWGGFIRVFPWLISDKNYITDLYCTSRTEPQYLDCHERLFQFVREIRYKGEPGYLYKFTNNRKKCVYTQVYDQEYNLISEKQIGRNQFCGKILKQEISLLFHIHIN